MKILIVGLLAGLVACASQPDRHNPPPIPGQPPAHARVGQVTKDMILAAGGACDRDDVCYDRQSRQDYDCEVEFYCVPTSVAPKARR